MGRRGELRIFHGEGKVRGGATLLCGASPLPAQPFLCPLCTGRFPLEPLGGRGETSLAQLRLWWILLLPMPQPGEACGGAEEEEEDGDEGHPMALGWRVEAGGVTAPSVHTWSCRGCVCAHVCVGAVQGHSWDVRAAVGAWQQVQPPFGERGGSAGGRAGCGLWESQGSCATNAFVPRQNSPSSGLQMASPMQMCLWKSPAHHTLPALAQGPSVGCWCQGTAPAHPWQCQQ